MVVRGVVDVVKAAGFEEEMPGLTAGHRDTPRDQASECRIGEQAHVGDEEAARADEVQRLVDAAVMVVTMVVPTLNAESFEIGVHGLIDN